ADCVVMNAYHSHPVGSSVKQSSPINTGLAYSRKFATTRITGKPFVVSEHNVAFWNQYRYEQAFGMGALAAFQDFEVLTIHGDGINLTVEPIWNFANSKDPVARACEFLTYFLFRRRDVKPGRSAIRVRVKESDIFSPNGPKGGMPAEQAITGLVSKLSLECVGKNSKPLPLLKNEILLNLDKSSAVSIGQGFMDSKDASQASMGAILKLLRQRGCLSAKNRTDGVHLFEADTDEFFLDLDHSYMEVNTPRFQGMCGFAGATAKLPNFQVHKMTKNGILSLVSVDGNAPLQDAKRMTLVYATNALNTGMTFRSDDMTLCTKKGTLPVLVLCGQFEVSITNKNAAKLNLYPLDFAGKRLKKIAPSSVQGNTARFAVDMRNDGHAFFYELSLN
ncbi:MAG: hypothetical protein IJJ26_12295, partial [Victivallales bacterium]|nr:hypothetical protein [Victivallales bacterium]